MEFICKSEEKSVSSLCQCALKQLKISWVVASIAFDSLAHLHFSNHILLSSEFRCHKLSEELLSPSFLLCIMINQLLSRVFVNCHIQKKETRVDKASSSSSLNFP